MHINIVQANISQSWLLQTMEIWTPVLQHYKDFKLNNSYVFSFESYFIISICHIYLSIIRFCMIQTSLRTLSVIGICLFKTTTYCTLTMLMTITGFTPNKLFCICVNFYKIQSFICATKKKYICAILSSQHNRIALSWIIKNIFLHYFPCVIKWVQFYV